MTRPTLLRLLVPVLALGLAACGGDGTSDPGGDTHQASGATCPTGSPLTYATFGEDFIGRYCLTCHSKDSQGAQRAGAPLDHNYDTLADVQKWKTEIDKFAAAGLTAVNTAMPPSRPTPTQAEREQLGQWLACGAQ